MATFIEDVANKNRDGVEQKEQRPTLEEIRNNPDQEQWKYLEVYLQSKGEQEIIDRLNEGSSTEQDIKTLQERRDSFLNLEEDVQRTTDQLTPENVARIANLSKELRDLSKVMPPEKIRAAIVDNLRHTAMRGGTSYKEMSEMLSMAFEEKVGMNLKMIKLGREHGISPEEYKAALMRMKENPRALEDAVGAKIPWFKSYFTSAETVRRKALMLDTRREIIENKIRLEEYDQQLGAVMRSFIFGNEKVRKSFLSRFTRSKEEAAPVSTATPTVEPIPTAASTPENKQEEKKVESEPDWKKLKVGDSVFWAPKGVEQWTQPKKILEIQDSGLTNEEKFARFEGSQNYAPLSEMRLASKDEKTEGAKPDAVLGRSTDQKEGGDEDRELSPKEVEKIEKAFREAQKTSKEKLSEEEARDARQKWQKYQIAHQNDEGFNLDNARDDFSAGYAKEKYAKEKMSFFSVISRLFFQDKIKDVVKHSL